MAKTVVVCYHFYMIQRGKKQNTFSMRSYCFGSAGFQKRSFGKRKSADTAPLATHESADARLLRKLIDAGASEAVIERLVPNNKASEDQLRAVRASKRKLIFGNEL